MEAGPITPAKQRLLDAFDHLLHAVHRYAEPVPFCKNINACIQELRNVTFVLQSHKSVIPGFKEWYEEWQSWMRQNDFLRWLVLARNRVVKQANLVTASRTTIRVVDSYDERGQELFSESADSSLTSVELAQAFRIRMRLTRTLPEHGLITIEREWRVGNQKDHELVSVLRYCLECLGYLLADCAERLLEVQDDGRDLPRLTELHQHLDHLAPRDFELSPKLRSATIELETGKPVHVRLYPSRTLTQADRKLVTEHYGREPTVPPMEKGVTLRELAHYYMQEARQVIARDAYHLPFVFFFRDHAALGMLGLEIGNHSQKYALSRKVAEHAQKSGANRVIMIGEVWTAPFDPLRPQARPDESLERREILTVHGISGEGDEIFLSARMGRVGEEVILAPTEEEVLSTRGSDFLEPVKRGWRLGWSSLVEQKGQRGRSGERQRRNDLCQCGSGKKHKHCCGRRF